jgi:hypothetical protein
MVFSSSGILSTNCTQYTTGWKYHRCLFQARYIPELVRTVFQLNWNWKFAYLKCFFFLSFFRANFCTMKTKKKLEKIGKVCFLKCKLEKIICYKSWKFSPNFGKPPKLYKKPWSQLIMGWTLLARCLES